MLTTVQLACIVMSKSGAPYANFGAQMSTGSLLFPALVYTVFSIHESTLSFQILSICK